MKVFSPTEMIEGYLRENRYNLSPQTPNEEKDLHEGIIMGAAKALNEAIEEDGDYCWDESGEKKSIIRHILDAVTALEGKYACYNQTESINNRLILQKALELLDK